MSLRKVFFLAAVAGLGIACISADALAARVAARGGAVANRGALMGARGGAVADRGGLYGRGYYRPGAGIAAGAVVGGAIAASQPWYGYGGYDAGYGYGPGTTATYYPPGNGYPYASYSYNSGPVSYDPGYAAASSYGPYGDAYAPGYLQSCTYVGGPKSMDWICR